MEIKGDFYVLLHSESQDAFVVDTMLGMVMKNVGAYVKGRTSDYIVLAMADTEEDLLLHKEKILELRATSNKSR